MKSKNVFSHLLIVALLFITLTACQPNHQTFDSDLVSIDIPQTDCFTEEAFGESVTLTSEPFNDSVLHAPRNLAIIGNKLFTVDISSSTDTLVRFYTLPGKQYGGYVYLKGQGPLELISPSAVCASADSSSFWVYDTARQLFIGQPLSLLQTEKPKTMDDCMFLSVPDSLKGGTDDMMWLDDKRILLSDLIHYKERFYIATPDSNDWQVQAVTNPKLHFKDTFDDNILADIFSTRKCITPDHRRVVLAGRYLDLLEIYDSQGNLLHLIKGPEDGFKFEFDTERSVTNHVLVKSRESRRAYLAVKATSDKIYALYSGKTKEDKEHYSYSRRLYVFSLDGQPLHRFQLDVPIIDFVVDEAAGMLYAASDNAEIVCYRIGGDKSDN